MQEVCGTSNLANPRGKEAGSGAGGRSDAGAAGRFAAHPQITEVRGRQERWWLLMAKQGVRQAARRRVQEALATKQKERVARDRRHSDLAVTLLAALAERDKAVTKSEAEAAVAVGSLVDDGLSLSEVGELCGGSLIVKELQRLAKLKPPESAEG